MKSQTFFLPGLAWDHNPADLSLLHRLGWQVCCTMPSYWLGWCLTNSLSGLDSNHHPPHS
jgi:hypothetical protein